MDPSSPPPNVAELSLKLLSGDATDEEVAAFNDCLKTDREAVLCALDVVFQEESLSCCLEPQSQFGSVEHAGVVAPQQASSTGVACSTPLPAADRSAAQRPAPLRIDLIAVAAMLLLAVAIASGVFSPWTAPGRHDAEHSTALLDPSVGDGASRQSEPARFIGTLVSSSACRWSPDQWAISESRELRYGEFLNLLEGVAEMRLDSGHGVAEIKVEGPAGLVLTANGGCNLSHGRLTAKVDVGQDAFVLDTPNCQATIRGSASVGVLVSGADVEVHVFDGNAAVLIPWGLGDASAQHFELAKGDALTLVQEPEGKIYSRLGAARPSIFVTKSSMRSDQLVIPKAYSDNVVALGPSLYWRFEGSSDKAIPDRSPAGDNAAIVKGAVGFVDNAGNRVLDLGSRITDEALNAHLLSAKPVSLSGAEGYTLELWIKPSHYHLGAIASLIAPAPKPVAVPGHGMMLQLGGPRTAMPWIERPGKIRFLHRVPPSSRVGSGSSCFSAAHYALRKWQHLVAAKDAKNLKLYCNGELVANAENDTSHSTDLHLIVGQIDESRRDRQFVGQIDELAFYPFPLTADDIHRHYEMVKRPKPNLTELAPSI